MVVQMSAGKMAKDPETEAVISLAMQLGLQTKVNTTKGTGSTVTEVYLLDDTARACTLPEHIFRQLPYVDIVRRVTPSAVSLAVNGHAGHSIQVGSMRIGNNQPCVLIAGPCAVDKRVGDLAEGVRSIGCSILRGGCWKPRSNPYSFPGFGKKAVRWLLQAAKAHAFDGVCIEVIDETHLVDVTRIADEVGYEGTIILWVGARTDNQILLRKLGRQRRFPIMLKNPIRMRTIDEWIDRAAFVIAGEVHFDESGKLIPELSTEQGNDQILLCSRGVEHTDEKSLYRFDPHHEVIASVRRRYWTPVGVDPSHSAGTMQDDLVLRNLQTALIQEPAFALIETYFNECNGLCDAKQAIPLSRMHEVVDMLEQHNRRFASVA